MYCADYQQAVKVKKGDKSCGWDGGLEF